MSRIRPRFVYNEARANVLTNLIAVDLNFHDKDGFDKSEFVKSLNRNLWNWIENNNVGRRYSGGLLKFEPGDLNKMPIGGRILDNFTSGTRALTSQLSS